MADPFNLPRFSAEQPFQPAPIPKNTVVRPRQNLWERVQEAPVIQDIKALDAPGVRQAAYENTLATLRTGSDGGPGVAPINRFWGYLTDSKATAAERAQRAEQYNSMPRYAPEDFKVPVAAPVGIPAPMSSPLRPMPVPAEPIPVPAPAPAASAASPVDAVKMIKPIYNAPGALERYTMPEPAARAGENEASPFAKVGRMHLMEMIKATRPRPMSVPDQIRSRVFGDFVRQMQVVDADPRLTPEQKREMRGRYLVDMTRLVSPNLMGFNSQEDF